MSNCRNLFTLLLLCSILPAIAVAQSDDQSPRPKAQQTVATNDAAETYTPEQSKGKGGELQQTATGDQPPLTTAQGIPVADNQNSLKIGERGPT